VVRGDRETGVTRVLSATTVRLYRGYLDNHVLKALGALSMRELRVLHLDNLVKLTHDRLSYDAAKSVRAALSGICGYAVRHGVYDTNPVHSVARLSRGQGEGKEVVALSKSQRADMLVKLEAYAVTRRTDSKGRRVGHRVVVWEDLPDLQRASLATGGRVGEVLAVSGEDVQRDRRGRLTVHLGSHIVRVTGRGLVRMPGRKGGKPGLLLIVPNWSEPMWLRRKAASGDGPLFRPRLAGGLIRRTPVHVWVPRWTRLVTVG
jgi:integrase